MKNTISYKVGCQNETPLFLPRNTKMSTIKYLQVFLLVPRDYILRNSQDKTYQK